MVVLVTEKVFGAPSLFFVGSSISDPYGFSDKTGRLFGTCLKENHKEAEKISNKVQTRAARLTCGSKRHQSAISDHVAFTNHIIDWEGTKILHHEDERCPRWIREFIWIRHRGAKAMNSEGGAAYFLSHQYDHLIQRTTQPLNQYIMHDQESQQR